MGVSTVTDSHKKSTGGFDLGEGILEIHRNAGGANNCQIIAAA